MITVIALMSFSDGVVSMFKGEIRTMDDTTAEKYISEGLVEEYDGGSGGNVLVFSIGYDETSGLMKCGKTWRELADAMEAGKFIVGRENTAQARSNYYVQSVTNSTGSPLTVSLGVIGQTGLKNATASSENDYPSWED